MLASGKHGIKICNSGRTKRRHKQCLEAALVILFPKNEEEYEASYTSFRAKLLSSTFKKPHSLPCFLTWVNLSLP